MTSPSYPDSHPTNSAKILEYNKPTITCTQEISLQISLLMRESTHVRTHLTAKNLWIWFGTAASVRATQVGGYAWHNNVMPNAHCHSCICMASVYFGPLVLWLDWLKCRFPIIKIFWSAPHPTSHPVHFYAGATGIAKKLSYLMGKI